MATGVVGIVLTLAQAPPPPPAGASTRPPIDIHITLATHRVVAGQPIAGTVDLTNTSHDAITVNTCASNGWLAVGLSGRVNSYPFGSFLVECPSTVRLAPGPNRFRVKVATTYASCTQPQPSGTPASPLSPNCVRDSTGHSTVPPLPAGPYTTKIHVVGLDGMTQPANQVVVTLEAPRRAPVPAACAETPTSAPVSETVPSVIGDASSLAAAALAETCLNAGWTTPVGTRVTSEWPVAGSTVPEYSTVTLGTT
jgi:hypothetical protein